MRKNILATLLIGALLLTPVISSAQSKRTLIAIDGSSTVFPISEAIAEEFQLSNKGKVQVTVGISGTGGGFKKFCRGDVDIANASRPITEKEMQTCRDQGIEYYELAIAYDAITVVANPSNKFLTQLNMDQLKTMWSPESQNKIKTWNQVDSSFPNEALTLFGPGADSGTFDYFTEAVNHKSKSSRGDFTASEDDNALVQGVMRSNGGLGYFGYAYYIENKDKLKAIAIVNPKTGKAVYPSTETVLSGEYLPLSRPLFIYVNAKFLAERPELKSYIDFAMKHGGELSKEVGFMALPEQAYNAYLQRIEAAKKGSVFGGVSEVGLTIEDLLKREPKL